MNLKLLYQWSEELTTYLPSLNSWQIANLALFSLGIIRAESCHQDEICRQISCGEKVSSTARRWRRFLSNVKFPLQAFFREWSKWVLSRMESEPLYLLVDETKLQARFGVMLVGVAWEGRCIPLVWRCYKANRADDYPAEGQVKMIEQLLHLIWDALPANKAVVVLADRGIGCSPDLCKGIDKLNGHFLFRVTKQTKICTLQGEFTIAETVQQGQIWTAQGKVFKQRGQLPARALARWSEGYDEPWALVTNADWLSGQEYALRNWQEQAFRDLKSYGWQWQKTRIRKVAHLQHLLVVLAVAYAWVLAMGAYAVHLDRAQPLVKCADGSLRRKLSLFKEGLICFAELVQRKTVCLTLCFVPDKRFT